MSIYYSTGGEDEDGVVGAAEWGCDECSTYYSWPVTPGLAPVDDPLQSDMRALVALHTPESCEASWAAAAVMDFEEADAEEARAAAEADYAFLESLGSHHPVEVEVTVAEAEERERRGIPLPIGGDPETDLARELVAISRPRTHWTPAQARTRTALAAIQRRSMIGGRLKCRSDNSDAVAS